MSRKSGYGHASNLLETLYGHRHKEEDPARYDDLTRRIEAAEEERRQAKVKRDAEEGRS